MANSISNEVSGVSQVLATNFQVFLDIYIEQSIGSGAFTRIDQKKADPSNDETVPFDLSEVLLSELSPFVPSPSSVDLQIADGPLKRWFALAVEASGDPQTADDSGIRIPSSREANYVLLAGEKYYNKPGSSFAADYFNGDPNKFLTREPSGMQVAKDQKRWLHFFNNRAGLPELNIRLVYTDDTQELLIISRNVPQSNNDKILAVPCGYNQLGLDDLKTTGKTVKYYDVWLDIDGEGSGSGSSSLSFSGSFGWGEAAAVTDVHRFELRSDFDYEHRYDIYFVNAFGVLDHIAMHGERDQGRAFTKQYHRLYTENTDTDEIEAQFTESDRDHIESFTFRTGQITAAQKDWLADLIGTRKAWILIEDQFRPLNIETTSWEDSDEEDIYELTISARYAFENPGLI
jgi:hypothetical protein